MITVNRHTLPQHKSNQRSSIFFQPHTMNPAIILILGLAVSLSSDVDLYGFGKIASPSAISTASPRFCARRIQISSSTPPDIPRTISSSGSKGIQTHSRERGTSPSAPPPSAPPVPTPKTPDPAPDSVLGITRFSPEQWSTVFAAWRWWGISAVCVW